MKRIIALEEEEEEIEGILRAIAHYTDYMEDEEEDPDMDEIELLETVYMKLSAKGKPTS